MPAPPEVGDGGSQVGPVEVLQEVEAEHPAHADGHVAVAGEVEVDLKPVGHGPQPGHGGGEGGEGVEGGVGQDGHIVGEDHLFPQARDEPGHTAPEVLPGLPPAVDLPGDGLIPDDGPGDELGEEGHIQPHIQDAPLGGGAAAVDVDDVAHGLEGVEGDADGQCQVDLRHGQAQSAQIPADKAQILENEQPRQIEDHRRPQPEPPAGPRPLHHPAEEPVGGDGGQQQHHIHRLTPGVEEEGDQQQEDVAEPPPAEEGVVVDQQHTGQKQEEKLGGGENHGRDPPAAYGILGCVGIITGQMTHVNQTKL